MNGFNWLTDYDYSGGDFRRFWQRLENGKNAILLGVTLPIKYYLAAATKRRLLFITPDVPSAAKAYSALSLFRDDVLLLSPKYDFLSYKSVAVGSNLFKRIRSMHALASASFGIMVAPLDALTNYLPKKDLFFSLCQTINVNTDIDYDALLANLARGGYKRCETVIAEGTFAAKGDVIDVYPVGANMPCRILLFDSYVESIKQFNVNSMTSVGSLDSVTLLPASDVFVSPDALKLALERFSKTVSHTPNAPVLRDILDDVSLRVNADDTSQTVWWLSPFMPDQFVTVADYLPSDTIIWFEEGRQIEEAAAISEKASAVQIKTLLSRHEICEIHKNYRPTFSQIKSELSVFPCAVSIPPITTQNLVTDAKVFLINTSPIPKYYSGDADFISDLDRYQYTGQDVVICAGTPTVAAKLCKMLNENNVAAKYLDEYHGEKGIMVTPLSIEYGYNLAEAKLVVIGTRDLNAQSTTQNAARRMRTKTTTPEAGDYVVHEVHGIGKCLGVETLKMQEFAHDYVVVEYRGGGKLYMPVENLNRLSKYVSTSKTPPQLNFLGGKAFEKTIEHVRESLKELSFNLLELYADRAKLKGYRYPRDTALQREFEDSFAFVETEDQLRAVREIKYDLEAGKIMDRLLCGDVGFGKTEVALRAAFKVIQDGKQVALLAPTTLLALQHYNLAKERFAAFGVECELFCRLRSTAELKTGLKRLKEGKIDFAIGTHRLLSSDVEFKDLGLLVLDEEQRFGVEHKEKIKSLRHNINVLSLSATPIPRTLHMAMSGIRDISLLETPPVDRLPVRTYVAEYTDGLVVDAVTQEMARGGQVFILSNRITGLEAYKERLAELIPEAKIVVAHGQMEPKELEKRVGEFYNKEADVLLCTTIIENGIDLPDANTLIVIDADRLGLSQMYQIRGRVGRSTRLGYAYFTVRSQLLLTDEAKQRLATIMENTSLGSGYKVAMADLEIRGAGDILGAKQSGHIAKIGYDLYCKLLNEAVDKLRGVEQEELPDTEIRVPLDFSVPDDVATALGGKMKLYKRISEIDSPDELMKVAAEYTGMVKKIPAGLINLMHAAMLKNLCSKLYITLVEIGDKTIRATFRDAEAIKNDELMKTVTTVKNIASFDLTGGKVKLVVTHEKSTPHEKLKFFTKFVMHSLQMGQKKD